MPQSPTIVADLSCARCGYDLRGLLSDSNCPECGHLIAFSLAAIPLGRWLPRFRRGVTFFGLAILLICAGFDWLMSISIRVLPYGWSIHRDVAIYALVGLMWFAAAWLMSTSASFFPRNPIRLRKWLIGLSAAELIFIAVRFCLNAIPGLLPHWRNLLTLCVNALLPLAFDVHLWLLLMLLIRPLPILPNPLPRAVIRVVQVLVIYTFLVPDVISVASYLGMVTHLEHPLPRGSYYLPTSWIRPLGIFLLPSEKFRPVIWWVLLLVIAHCRYRLQSRLGLWPQTKEVSFESAL